MKLRYILTILMVAIASLGTISAESAGSILKQTASKITVSKKLTADFSIHGQNGSTIKGNATVDGNKFAFISPESSVIYNGKTQWTADASTKEITIIEPEPEEMQQLNPFAIIKSYDSSYQCRLISTAGNNYRIEMTPKDSDNSISKAILTINSSTYLPSRVEMRLSDGTTLRIDITNIKTKVNIPSTKFVLQTKDFPGYEQIDLR